VKILTRQPVQDANDERLRYQGWGVVAASSVGVFFASSFIMTFALLLRPLSEEFSWSRESISYAFGAMTLSVAMSIPLVGHLVDRRGPAWVAGPSLMLAAAAFASLSVLTANLWHLYAVYVVIGLGFAGTSPVVYSRVVSGWFDRRRGMALGAVIASAGAGAIVHPPAMQALIRAAGWRGACLVLGLVIVAVGVPAVARFVREPGRHARRTHAGPPATAVSRALRSRIFWTLLVVVFGMTLALNGVVVHLSALLMDRGLPASQAVAVMSAMGGASVAGRLLTGWLIDRFDAKHVAFVLLAIAALGVYLLAGATSFSAGALAAVCIGFGTGGEVDVVPYLLSRYFGIQSLATLFGVIWTAVGLASTAGPILMGRVFDATGSYASVLSALAVGVIATAGLMLTLPSYQPRRADIAPVADSDRQAAGLTCTRASPSPRGRR
jgi:MFS family permease